MMIMHPPFFIINNYKLTSFQLLPRSSSVDDRILGKPQEPSCLLRYVRS